MKKLITILAVAIILSGSVLMINESQITRNVKGEIISVDNGIVTIDALGQAWEWGLEEGENFTEGQKVEIDFRDFGLDDLTVWEIIKIEG